MSKMTIEGFIDFVNAQPDDKMINHGDKGWTTCAVGEYANSVGQEPDVHCCYPGFTNNFSDPTKGYEGLLYKELPMTHDLLNIKSLEIGTYKDLKDQIDYELICVEKAEA